MVHPEIRNTIPDQQVLPPIVGTDKVQNRTHDKKAEITQGNELGVLGLVQRARGVEMVHTTEVTICLALSSALRLVLVVVVTGDVGKEIHGPSEELLQENGGGRENRGFLHQFTQFVDRLANARSKFVTGLGNEDHITSDVTGGLVVFSVGDLPGEVGDKQGGMANPANGVVQSLGRGEGLVTALVGQNPDTGTKETLDDGVQTPQCNPSGREGHSLGGHKVVEEAEDGRKDHHIPGHIGQTSGG